MNEAQRQQLRAFNIRDTARKAADEMLCKADGMCWESVDVDKVRAHLDELQQVIFEWESYAEIGSSACRMTAKVLAPHHTVLQKILK